MSNYGNFEILDTCMSTVIQKHGCFWKWNQFDSNKIKFAHPTSDTDRNVNLWKHDETKFVRISLRIQYICIMCQQKFIYIFHNNHISIHFTCFSKKTCTGTFVRIFYFVFTDVIQLSKIHGISWKWWWWCELDKMKFIRITLEGCICNMLAWPDVLFTYTFIYSAD